MENSRSIQNDELRHAYHEYDQQVTLKNIQIGCVLGILLMPAGWVLDRFDLVYRQRQPHTAVLMNRAIGVDITTRKCKFKFRLHRCCYL